jgi:hypothetical protein
LEFTIAKETFQNFSNFIVKRVTKFHKNAKYNEFFVAYSHSLGKKSLDFEGKKNKNSSPHFDLVFFGGHF